MADKLHKYFLICLKYVPVLIACAYFTNAIVSCIGVKLWILQDIFFLSPITALFILCASFVFKFCIWHRLPIYYSLILEIFDYLNLYIPISGRIDLFIYLILTILFIILGMYFKNNTNKKRHQSVIDSA